MLWGEWEAKGKRGRRSPFMVHRCGVVTGEEEMKEEENKKEDEKEKYEERR